MTGHLSGLIVKANTGKEKTATRSSGWSGKATHWVMLRSSGSRLSLLPSLADGGGAGSCSTQRCKDGHLIPNYYSQTLYLNYSQTQDEKHTLEFPRPVHGALTGLQFKRHRHPFAPKDLFSAKLQTSICQIIWIINLNYFYFTVTWERIFFERQAQHFKTRWKLCYHLSPHLQTSRDSHQIQHSRFPEPQSHYSIWHIHYLELKMPL